MAGSAIDLLDRSLDRLAVPKHAGMLVPWANAVVEAEMPSLVRARIVWHYARLVPDSRSTALGPDFLTGLVRAIPGSLDQLSQLDLDVVCFACTSASLGLQAQKGVDPGPVLLTAFAAILRALRALDARRVLLVTPYEEVVTAAECRALEAAGLEVTGARSLGRTDDFQAVPAREVGDAARSLISRTNRPDVDAIVLSCTNMPTLTLVPEMESETGCAVVSSNMALATATALLQA